MGIAFLILFMGCGRESANSQDNASSSGDDVKKISQQPKKSPSVFIPENSYEFPSVVDGTQVMHDFTILNKGDGDLEIKRVKTGWGCTAAFYTRLIPPGEEGKIKIKLDTNERGGKELKKYITVYTNDPNNPKPKLIIYGNVERFASIKPPGVSLRGYVGEAMQKDVRITPREEYPFKIVTSNTQYGKHIAFQLNEHSIGEATEYLLKIKNITKEKGIYRDKIILRTNSGIKPKIKIPVYVKISERQKENTN